MINIFKHLANSYLISHVVLNSLEDSFVKYLMPSSYTQVHEGPNPS